MAPKHYIDWRMRLHAGALHIWRADLDATRPEIERLLDEQERERAARIVREPARRRWIVARGVLRMLLGAYTEVEPSALRFAREADGKPTLALPARSQLRFSLSHSGGLAVYALTEIGAVGVDVELVNRRAQSRRRIEKALAGRVSHGAPTERLVSPDAQARHRELLCAWVGHEAEGKRLGVGARSATGSTVMGASPPWIARLELGEEAVGAVALAVKPVYFRVNAVDF